MRADRQTNIHTDTIPHNTRDPQTPILTLCTQLPYSLKRLACSLITRQEWNDDYLTWDPDNYDGVEQLVLSPSVIWLPDIGIHNRSA